MNQPKQIVLTDRCQHSIHPYWLTGTDWTLIVITSFQRCCYAESVASASIPPAFSFLPPTHAPVRERLIPCLPWCNCLLHCCNTMCKDVTVLFDSTGWRHVYTGLSTCLSSSIIWSTGSGLSNEQNGA